MTVVTSAVRLATTAATVARTAPVVRAGIVTEESLPPAAMISVAIRALVIENGDDRRGNFAARSTGERSSYGERNNTGRGALRNFDPP